MIDFDISRRPGRPSEWQSLAEAVLSSDESEENYWLELKSNLDWTKGDAVGTLGKAILALANRDVQRASNTLEGRGVVVVTDIEPLDNADLENKLATFVGGSDGPRWEPHWVRIDDKPVLVIEVDAPANGDPGYTLRQKFKDYRASQVFVRETGKTVIANQSDMARLARRMLANDTPDSLDVQLGFTLSEPLSTYFWDEAAVESFLSEDEARLAASLAKVAGERERAAEAKAAADQAARAEAGGTPPRDFFAASQRIERDPVVPASLLAMAKGAENAARLITSGLTDTHQEDRSPEAFKLEVARYVGSARTAMPDALWTIAKRVVPIPTFWLTNLSERNYTAVEVTIRVEGDAKAESGDYEEEVSIRTMLPKRPRKYGPWTTQTVLGGLLGNQSYNNFASMLPRMDYGVASPGRREIQNDGSFRARFDPIDLRPKDAKVEVESDLVILIPRDRVEPVLVKWEATASNVDAIQRGEFELPFDGDPIDILAVGLGR